MSDEIQVRERPILFNGEMVQAILDGRKTQTRRAIKVHPDWRYGVFVTGINDSFGVFCDFKNFDPQMSETVKCPYGVPGDLLWVREAFAVNAFDEYLYRADPYWEGLETRGFGWKSSRYMPRAASRITLEVVSVRVERVQDISEGDADAEVFGGDFPHVVMPEHFSHSDGKKSLVECYAELWDSIYAKRGYGWNVNPWVWVVEFRLLEAK